MITNIAYKTIACMQQSMFQKHQEFASSYPRAALPLATVVTLADVFFSTSSFPAVALENLISSGINTVGSPFSDRYTLLDAKQSFKIALVMSLIGTPIMVGLSPFRLMGRFMVNLPNPKEAQSCNEEAEEQAGFPLIAYDSRECRALKKAIEDKNCDAIKEILASDLLTKQSLGVSLEKAAENGYIDAMELLLADPTRLIKQSITRALEKATKNNHSEIIPLLLAELIRPAVDKANQNPDLPLDKKKHQKDNQFIAQCLDRIIQIAEKNGNTDLVNKLNQFKIAAKI